MPNQNRICKNGRNVQPGPANRKTFFLGRSDACGSNLLSSGHIVNTFLRPTILQLNIEGLTASKMTVLHHLAVKHRLSLSYCTSAEALMLPGFALAGFLIRKHGLASFVHKRLEYSLLKESPFKSGTKWLCIDVDRYIMVNVSKPQSTRLQASDSCLYAGDFNCPHVDWGYGANSLDRESLAGWASTNSIALLYIPKDSACFNSGRWNSGINLDLAFASVDLDSRLPNRRILEKFPRSQHCPSVMAPPRFALRVPSTPVKRWNFCKAK